MGRLTRRGFLATAAAGGATLTAGCSSSTGVRSTDGSVPVVWPAVTSGKIRTWSEIERRRRQYPTQAGVTPYERTVVYEDTELRSSIRAKTLDRFDSTLAMFFATHIDLRGWTTALATPSRIAETLRPQFRRQMEANGTEDVREGSPTGPTPSVGSSPVVTELRGTFRTPEISEEIPFEGVEKERLEFPSERLDVVGLLAIWKPAPGTGLAAGGVYPGEDYEQADVLSITSTEGDGLDLKAEIDLNLQPGKLRREIVSLIESVEVAS
jgi:hypothetical protein